jgi:hypothetical protein
MPNKKISELPENINPSGSDIFPLVHSGETMYQTLSGLTQYVNNNLIEKVYFYEINYNGSPSLPIENPIGVSGYTVQNARITAPYLFEAFGTEHPYITGTSYENYYANMLFEVIEENGINVDGLQFSSNTELSTYLSSNLSATTANTVANKFTVKMYGVKKNVYQKLNKIRGINTLFSNLRGRNSYWRQKVTDGNVNDAKLNNFSAAEISSSYKNPKMTQQFLTAVYTRFLGIDPYTYKGGLNIDDVKRTIWFPEERKHFYNLWPISEITVGHNIAISYPVISGTRTVFNTGFETFGGNSPTTMVDSAIFMLSKGGDDIFYTSGYHLDSGYIADGRFLSNTQMLIPLPILSKTGTYLDINNEERLVNIISAVRVYKLTNVDGDVCFYVKPIGIDTLVVDYIEDNTDAILYGLFSSTENGRQMLVRFDDSTKTNNKTGNAGWRLALDDYELCTLDKVSAKCNIEPYKYLNQFGTRVNRDKFRNFRLFYGYPDGSISPLSDDEIYHVINANGYQVKRLVRKNPIN